MLGVNSSQRLERKASATEQAIRIEDATHLLPAPLHEVLLVLALDLRAESGAGACSRVEIELAEPRRKVCRAQCAASHATRRRAAGRARESSPWGRIGPVPRPRRASPGALFARPPGTSSSVPDERFGARSAPSISRNAVGSVGGLGRQLGTGGADVHRLPAAGSTARRRAAAGWPAARSRRRDRWRTPSGSRPAAGRRRPPNVQAGPSDALSSRLVAEPAGDAGVEGGDEAGRIPLVRAPADAVREPRHVHRRPGAQRRAGVRAVGRDHLRMRPRPGLGQVGQLAGDERARRPRGPAAAVPARPAAVRRRRGRRRPARTTAAAGRRVRSWPA